MANGSTAVCHFLFDRKANKPDTAKKAIENKIEKAIRTSDGRLYILLYI